MTKKKYEKPKLKIIKAPPDYTTMKVYTASLESLRVASAMSGESMIEMASRLFDEELKKQEKKRAKKAAEVKESEKTE